jgi:Zn-dependent peptidase ImmA (M78 family)
MGGYMPEEHKIWVYINNRNTADIIRTLAHELVHAKQKEDSHGKSLDGSTGSEHENEANALAGVILRTYGKQNPEIYN